MFRKGGNVPRLRKTTSIRGIVMRLRPTPRELFATFVIGMFLMCVLPELMNGGSDRQKQLSADTALVQKILDGQEVP